MVKQGASRDQEGNEQHGEGHKDTDAGKSGKSLSVSLTQALLTSDKALLESMLQTTDIHTIEATVADMPSSLALSLLEFICSNVIRVPNQLYGREGWINTLLRHNCAFFSQNTAGRATLLKLNKHIKQRLSANQALLRLKGKVDTVVYLSSIETRKRQRETIERNSASEPLVTYED
ncbi:Dip2/Utp12 family protein [Babesia bovis T2Bo]|uniref:Dip2/Utp12 family protein n=1 Tax=Babesia bovis T2Bo TaxID=484906 RepID=UPI001C362B90|nr:Dip2/Utp12 family protein [Babesia bovis T2Bo]EDO05521.2 Dip2/Utp12 family protein [Babesia bovis T2Bo]